MNVYRTYIFYEFLLSPPPVGNTSFCFLHISFYFLSVSTIFPSSAILDSDLPTPNCWSGICRWCITAFFSYNLIFLLPLSFMFYFFSWVNTGNKNGSPSNVLSTSLDIFGTIISSLKCSPRSPLTKSLFSFMMESLIVCKNGL